MHNNIQNGWRPVITKIIIILGLTYLVSICIPVLVSSFAADSKWVCGSNSDVGHTLVSNNEDIIASGSIGDNDFLMTFWASPRGDWTLVATKNSGDYSCVVIHGSGLKTLKSKTFI